LRSTGQTVLAMVGVGFGGTASNAAAGWLLERMGANAPYLAGGIGASLLACSLFWILPRPERTRWGERDGGAGRPSAFVGLDV
jgi:hypothetical protein